MGQTRVWIAALVLLAGLMLTGLPTTATAQRAEPGAAEGAGALELASLFVDDAILQRGMAVPVWGWAQPGAAVTVSFAGQEKTTTADGRGQWRVDLDALEASAQERDLTVTSGDESLTIGGVLVGEVWFSSGQSNMDWTAGKSMVGNLARELSREQVPIREYNVDIGSSLYPCSRADAEGGWRGTGDAGNFSALSLAFAHELYTQLGVPIGIVRSTHGATPIETWTPYEGFAAHEELADIARGVLQANPTTRVGQQAYEQYYADLRAWQRESEAVMARGGEALARPALPGIASEWKGATRMYNRKIAPLVPYAIRGVIWCQGTHNAGDGRIYATKMQALLDGLREVWGRPDLPFYFTQMQCYGEADANDVGFADIREAQTLFFMNADNVGMVPQYDLNPATPGAIHYSNKLHPGWRLARWALAHDYDFDIAYAGPIYQSHTIEGNTVRVQFEQRGPGGELMVGSKGMEADARENPDAYVEPARPTPDQPLMHFRLAGADRVWHDAVAVIERNEVVVRCDAVPEPVGVQYAYSASPIGANLYNEAGLPATPFAYFDGEQMFEEDRPGYAEEQAARAARYIRAPRLSVASLFRTGTVVQRDQTLPVWGHGIPGSTITVTFGTQTATTTVGEFEYWQVNLDPEPASTEGRALVVQSDQNETQTVNNVRVGDVWILTGTRRLDGELIRFDENNPAPEPLADVYEFRIKTKTRRFRTPRRLGLEIGGGRYVASWQPADFDDVGDAPSVFAYYFAAQVRQDGVPLGIVTLGSNNPPITWVSYDAVQTAPGFEAERDDINLAYPNTEACKNAIDTYIETVREYNDQIAEMLIGGREIPEELANGVPAFPQPYFNEWSDDTETPTHTFNFCISPLVPYAIAGVVWLPNEQNLGSDIARYSSALEIYANSLDQTWGQDGVRFVYAQPTADLAAGITAPQIDGAASVPMTAWPQSLQEIATQMGQAAAEME